MDFQTVVNRRRMVRTFTDQPIPDAVLQRILDNARRGPSAGYSQGQAFLVLRSPAALQRFWDLGGGEAVAESVRTAPVVVVPLSSKRIYLDRYARADKGWTDRDESRWPVPFWHIDTGMATLLMLLTTVDEGLGALYFGIVPPVVPKFLEAFGVPEDHEPIGAVAIGYSAETDRPDLRHRRRPLNDLVHYDQWS